MRSSWSDPELDSALIALLGPVDAAVPAGAGERMLAALPSQAPAQPLWNRRPLRYALAAAFAGLALVLGASPQAREAVANTVQRFFYYLPGQGIRSALPQSLVLAEPASVSHGGVTVRVLSVLATENATTIAYEASGMQPGKSGGSLVDWRTTFLDDSAGRSYRLRSAASSVGGSPSETRENGLLTFEPLHPGARIVILRLGALRLELSLVTAAESGLRPADLSANMVTLHGVSLRVDGVDRSATGLVAHVSGLGARLSRLQSVDAEPPLAPDAIMPSSGLSGEFDLSLPAGATSLRIARIEVVEAGATTVPVNVPSDGSFVLNLKVRLGEYDLILERGRWVDDGNGRTLYIDFRPADVVDGGEIEGFDLDGVGSWGVSWLYANRSGTLMIANAPTGHVRLRLENPRAVIEGPWDLPLTAGG